MNEFPGSPPPTQDKLSHDPASSSHLAVAVGDLSLCFSVPPCPSKCWGYRQEPRCHRAALPTEPHPYSYGLFLYFSSKAQRPSGTIRTQNKKRIFPTNSKQPGHIQAVPLMFPQLIHLQVSPKVLHACSTHSCKFLRISRNLRTRLTFYPVTVIQSTLPERPKAP